MPSTLGRWRKRAKLSAPVALTNENDDDGGRLLPTDVFYEVLLRVPAKELCRLRLVCRSWRSLTSDPGFARAHALRHPLLFAGTWNNTEVHLLDLSCCNKIVKRVHVPERLHDLSTDLGLLCVSPTIGQHSYVLDPVAGEVVATLPDAEDDIELLEDGSFPSVPGLIPEGASFRGSSPSLLGHVPSTGEYKAVRINSYSMGGDMDNGGLLGREKMTQTFNVITVAGAATAGGSDGSIRWRARPCPPVGGSSCLRDRVVVAGVAYFLRRPSYDNYYHAEEYSKDIEPDAIFAFDLATEEWRPNTLRGPLSSNSDNELKFSQLSDESLQLCVLDGCLVIAHHKNWDCSMDLWFLDQKMDDMDNGLWNKRYSIQCVPGCSYRHSSKPPCPLHVLEDGRIVMWGVEQQEKVLALGVYDPRTNMYARLVGMEEYGSVSVSMHLGSLLCSSSGLQI